MRSLIAVLFVSLATAPLLAAPASAGGPQGGPYNSYHDQSWVVREDGKIVGRDPDANVRYELLRDAYGRDN